MNKEQRPILSIERTPFDNFLEIAALAVLITLWVIAVINYNSLPDIIPVHFNFSGEPDGYGSKNTIWLLPVISTFIYILLTFLSKRPHTLNYLNPVTPENALRQYRLATHLLRILKVIIPVIFLLIVLLTIRVSQKNTFAHSKLLLPVILAMVFIPVSYSFIKCPGISSR